MYIRIVGRDGAAAKRFKEVLMELFYKRPEEKESPTLNETYVELVDSPKNLQQIIKSIKDYAVNGNRLLISAQAFDEIELVEAILTACGFVEKSFIDAIIDCLSQTRSDYEKLQGDFEDLSMYGHL